MSDTAHPVEPTRTAGLTEPRELTLEGLRARRDEILRIAAAHGAENERVFGSMARGEADSASDVDLLVDIVADVHGFDYFGLLEDLRRALEELLDRKVDVVNGTTLGRIPSLSRAVRRMQQRILREAVPL